MFVNNLKICGITSRETARFCAETGAGALGVVFFEKSPRCVTPQQARFLFEGLPERVARVGVFVDVPAEQLIAMAREATLDTVQLHGNEPFETIRAVQQAGFHVVKVLKTSGEKMMSEARALPQKAGILIECGRGSFPGGNGAAWNWADAAPLATLRPFALAGGLTPQNLGEAACLSQAAAWDVSSGVESAPGIKDYEAIRNLLESARKIEEPYHLNFWKGIYELRQT